LNCLDNFFPPFLCAKELLQLNQELEMEKDRSERSVYTAASYKYL